MKINDIYEVTKKEYEALVNELIPEKCNKINNIKDDGFEIHYYDKNNERHFAAQICTEQEGELVAHYYIIDMPQPQERKASRIVRQITLNDEESVKEFFNWINSTQKREK